VLGSEQGKRYPGYKKILIGLKVKVMVLRVHVDKVDIYFLRYSNRVRIFKLQSKTFVNICQKDCYAIVLGLQRSETFERLKFFMRH